MFGLFYMVVFAKALAYAAWLPVVGRLKASVASLSLLVVPCIGVASSALLEQRAIGAFDLAALACVLGAIALVVRRPAAPPAEETGQQADLAVPVVPARRKSAVRMEPVGSIRAPRMGKSLREASEIRAPGLDR